MKKPRAMTLTEFEGGIIMEKLNIDPIPPGSITKIEMLKLLNNAVITLHNLRKRVTDLEEKLEK